MQSYSFRHAAFALFALIAASSTLIYSQPAHSDHIFGCESNGQHSYYRLEAPISTGDTIHYHRCTIGAYARNVEVCATTIDEDRGAAGDFPVCASPSVKPESYTPTADDAGKFAHFAGNEHIFNRIKTPATRIFHATVAADLSRGNIAVSTFIGPNDAKLRTTRTSIPANATYRWYKCIDGTDEGAAVTNSAGGCDERSPLGGQTKPTLSYLENPNLLEKWVQVRILYPVTGLNYRSGMGRVVSLAFQVPQSLPPLAALGSRPGLYRTPQHNKLQLVTNSEVEVGGSLYYGISCDSIRHSSNSKIKIRAVLQQGATNNINSHTPLPSTHTKSCPLLPQQVWGSFAITAAMAGKHLSVTGAEYLTTTTATGPTRTSPAVRVLHPLAAPPSPGFGITNSTDSGRNRDNLVRVDDVLTVQSVTPPVGHVAKTRWYFGTAGSGQYRSQYQTGANYTVTQADVDAQTIIQARVYFERTANTPGFVVQTAPTASTNAMSTVALLAGTISSNRSLGEVVGIGSVLDAGDATDPLGSVITQNLGYQWRRCDDQTPASCVDITDPNATSRTYRVAAADVSKHLRVRVTVSVGGNAHSADSAPFLVDRLGSITAISTATTFAEGSALTAGLLTDPENPNGANTPIPPSAIEYTWQQADPLPNDPSSPDSRSWTTAENGRENVSGGNTYQVSGSQSQVGKFIRVVARYELYGGGTVYSAATPAIANVDDPGEADPITGVFAESSAQVTNILYAPNASGIRDPDGLAAAPNLGYTWQWTTDDITFTPIAAPSRGYFVIPTTQQWVGRKFQVIVFYDDPYGHRGLVRTPLSASIANVNDGGILRALTGNLAQAGQAQSVGVDGVGIIDEDGLPNTGTVVSDYEWQISRGLSNADFVRVGGGATAHTYDIPDAQDVVGKYLRVRVTYTDRFGNTDTAVSQGVAISDQNDSGTVTIDRATAGQPSSATLADPDGGLSGVVYQWQDCAMNDVLAAVGETAHCTDINQATAQSYTPQFSQNALQLGSRIRVRVDYYDSLNNSGDKIRVYSNTIKVTSALSLPAAITPPELTVGGNFGGDRAFTLPSAGGLDTTYTLTGDTLGLTVSARNSKTPIVLSGTPDRSGESILEYRAVDAAASNPQPLSKQIRLKVNPIPSLAAETQIVINVGHAIAGDGRLPAVATNTGTAPFTYALTPNSPGDNLGAGLQITDTGTSPLVISGTPTESYPQPRTYRYTATDANGVRATAEVSVHVVGATIADATQTCVLGTPCSIVLDTASGGSGTYVYSDLNGVALPQNFAALGGANSAIPLTISGTPTPADNQVGVHEYTFGADDIHDSADALTAKFTLRIIDTGVKITSTGSGINGVYNSGDVVTVSNTLTSRNGEEITDLAYEWQICENAGAVCVSLQGERAAAPTFTVRSFDRGTRLGRRWVRVIVTTPNPSPERIASPSVPLDSVGSIGVITGALVEDQLITAGVIRDPDDPSASPIVGGVTYQWYRGVGDFALAEATPIGSNQNTYRLDQTDLAVDGVVTYKVVAEYRAHGGGTLVSAAFMGEVATKNLPPQVILNQALVDQPSTVQVRDPDYADAVVTEPITYQWQLCQNPNCTAPQSLSSGAAYTPNSAQLGKYLRALVTYGTPGAGNRGAYQAASNALVIERGFTATQIVADMSPQIMASISNSVNEAVTRRILNAISAPALNSAPTFSSNGSSNLAAVIKQNAEAIMNETHDSRKFLGSTRFSLPLAGADLSTARPALWGSGSYQSLRGEIQDAVWDGAVTGFSIGVDAKTDAQQLLGLGFNHSDGKFSITHAGKNFDYAINTNSITPYFGWESRATKYHLAVSLTRGQAELSGGENTRTNAVKQRGFSLGMSRPISADNRLKADVYYAQADTGYAQLKSSRARLMLHKTIPVERIDLVAKLGGSVERGAETSDYGVEIGATAGYSRDRIRVTSTIRGLVSERENLSEWGAQIHARYRPAADGQGLGFYLAPRYGQIDSKIGELWKNGLFEASSNIAAASPAPLSIATQLSYGLKPPSAAAGLFTPYITASTGNVNAYGVGLRWNAPRDDLEISLIYQTHGDLTTTTVSGRYDF